MSIQTHLLSSLFAGEAVAASFNTGSVIIDPGPGCSVGLFVAFATGFSASAILQASIDGVRFSDVPGTAQSVSANGNYMWVLASLPGIKRVRVSVTISTGLADFQVISGVG